MYSQMEAYINFLLLQQQQRLAPPTPAETLKALLTNPVQSVVTPPPVSDPVVTKRVIHSVLKSPLFISNERKVSSIGNSPIAFKEVTDPSVAETDQYRHYALCGECESVKLFRNLASLAKHRRTTCKHASRADMFQNESVEDIVDIENQTKDYIDGLSDQQLIEELKKLDPRASACSRDEASRKLLLLVTQPETLVQSTQVQVPDLSQLTKAYEAKATSILQMIPNIPIHLLAIALIVDLPLCSQAQHLHLSVATQTSSSTPSLNHVGMDSKCPRVKPVMSKSQRARVRRSSRLAQHN